MATSAIREMYVRRVRSAVAYSMLHQVVVLLAYLALMDATPQQPLMWLKTCFLGFLSVKTFACLGFMSVVTFLQVIFFSKRLTLPPPCGSTRLKAFIQMFSTDNFITFVLHLLMGFSMGYMYVNSESNPEQYDDDEYIFKLLCTTFTGAYFFFQDFTSDTSYIQLPTLAGLAAKTQIKQDAIDKFKNSIWSAMKPFFYFNILYYFCGGTVGKALSSMPGMGGQYSELSSIFQLLHAWRLFSSYVLCLTVLMVLSTMKPITSTILSRHCRFSITKNPDHFTMSEALVLNEMPFVQQLASQDLIMVAENEPSRRAELYMLSQPGGHPHNWQGVLIPFIALVESMCSDLLLVPQATAVSVPPSAPQQEVNPKSPALRNMALHAMHKKTPVPNVQATNCNTLSTGAQGWFKQQLDLLLKKPPVAFLFGERAEAKIAHALIVKGQTISFLVRAFSTMVQVSSSEDKYGIIQQSLPNIIIAILNLKSAVDKVGTVCRKQNKSTQPHAIMKNILRESTVQAMYKIIVTFKHNLDELNLPVDVKKQLQGFKEFKET